MTCETVLDSPLGELTLREKDGCITHLLFGAQTVRSDSSAVLEAAKRQLEEYFAGDRRGFDLPLAPEGTAFQKQVWSELMKIPYGETRTYGDIARVIAKPGAARAVGMANNRNPISVIIPCHRVVGASGALTGYGGGLDKKAFLLQLEKHL